MFLSAAVWTKSRVTMARPEYSKSDVMNLAKKHDWNYIDSWVGRLGEDYGLILGFYRDELDNAGTPH